jgi:hypothetical protein
MGDAREHSSFPARPNDVQADARKERKGSAALEIEKVEKIEKGIRQSGRGEAAACGSAQGLGAKLAGGGSVFAAALAALTGVALYAARGRDLGWVLVARGPAVVKPAAEGDVSIRVYMSNLAQWTDLEALPPEEVSRLSGRPAEIEGLARLDGDAHGFWLVAKPEETLSAQVVPAQHRVWVGWPRGKPARNVVEAGSRIRVRGVLRVGRFPAPAGASLDGIYSLELGTIETRPAAEHEHGDGCGCGHEH